jgi:DNA-binding PadR family transcriptional regulator
MFAMHISLSQSEFYILLSLAIKERHGYEIMQQVEHDSGGKVLLGPGTLYGSIKRMLQSNLIEEVAGDHPRRKYYRLTEVGRKTLAFELERYNDVVDLAKRTGLFQQPGLFKSAS